MSVSYNPLVAGRLHHTVSEFDSDSKEEEVTVVKKDAGNDEWKIKVGFIILGPDVFLLASVLHQINVAS